MTERLTVRASCVLTKDQKAFIDTLPGNTFGEKMRFLIDSKREAVNLLQEVRKIKAELLQKYDKTQADNEDLRKKIQDYYFNE